MRIFFIFIAVMMLVACSHSDRQEEDSRSQQAVDSVACERIGEFYSRYVFGDEEVYGDVESTKPIVEKYCTEKLAQKLLDENDYDCGGYAMYLFWSHSDDDTDSRVVDIDPMGDCRYRVVLDAGGWCIISVVVRDDASDPVGVDDILFDDIGR